MTLLRAGASERAMFRLCRHQLLAVLTVFAVMCGFAHQVEGRFTLHHHCAETDACCDHRSDSHSPEHDDQPCDHALCSHSILALVESPAPALIRAWTLEARAAERAVHPPGVEPAEIEHPPQLG